MDEFFSIRDCNGQFVFVRKNDMYEALAKQDFKLFGMGVETIIEFVTQYQMRNGPMPITRQSVIEVYNALGEPRRP